MFGGDEGLKYAGSRATRVSTRPIDVFFEKLLLVGISSIYLKSIVQWFAFVWFYFEFTVIEGWTSMAAAHKACSQFTVKPPGVMLFSTHCRDNFICMSVYVYKASFKIVVFNTHDIFSNIFLNSNISLISLYNINVPHGYK